MPAPSDMIGWRVRVGDHVGVLRGLPPAGGVFMFDEALGRELVVATPLEGSHVSDARYKCDKCGRRCNAVFDHPDRGGEWCAACAVPFAQQHQAPPTCEECGAKGAAVRNPSREAGVDKRQLCRQCHAKVGASFAVPPAVTRESSPLPGGQGRPVCAAAHVAGTVQCDGNVRPRRPTNENLCNAHAGTARLGERR